MSERLCVVCKHFEFHGGDPGYSEMTPGSEMTIDCGKDLWRKKRDTWFEAYGMDADDFRRLIRTAATCPHFEEARDE